LAIALGYKGHSGLIEAAKFRAVSDNNESLVLFSNADISDSIVCTYMEKLPEADIDLMTAICNALANQERSGWSPAVTDLTDRSKLCIKIFLTKDGIEFLNLRHKYLIPLKWDDCICLAKHHGVQNGRSDLIVLLEDYLDEAILIEGQPVLDLYDHISPLLRTLYYAAEDKHRDYINQLNCNEKLISIL
jgi:hypothetical protein